MMRVSISCSLLNLSMEVPRIIQLLFNFTQVGHQIGSLCNSINTIFHGLVVSDENHSLVDGGCWNRSYSASFPGGPHHPPPHPVS